MYFTRGVLSCVLCVFSSQSGSLLLSEFINFIYLVASKDGAAFNGMKNDALLIQRFLGTKTNQFDAQHPETVGSLVLLSLILANGKESASLVEWARTLLKRGANIHATNSEGKTALYNWCSADCLLCSDGVIMLLEAGADLLGSRDNHSQTPLWRLCTHKSVEVIRDLVRYGWLDIVPLDACITHVRSMIETQEEEHVDQNTKEILELLSSQRHNWQRNTRSAVVATLTCHEQLIPDIAECVVSYIDGRLFKQQQQQ